VPLKTPRVFISHSHHDKAFVRSLAKKLLVHNIDVWYDDWELRFGDSLISKIRQGIDEVDFLLAVISPSSVNSQWVQKELDVAMNREIENRRVNVIPLVRKECELPGFLKGKLYADFQTSHKSRSSFPKLVASIHRHLQEP
jgi:predicted nucleotide-binding protein